MIPHSSSYVEQIIEKRKKLAQIEQENRKKIIVEQIACICQALEERFAETRGTMDLSEVLDYKGLLPEVVKQFEEAGWDIIAAEHEHPEDGPYVRTCIGIQESVFAQSKQAELCDKPNT